MSDNIVSNAQLTYRKYIKGIGFTKRESQEAMIEFIDGVLNEEKAHGLIEGGTGTGKTIGLSLPIIERGIKKNKKVIISVPTTTLQSQIANQDLENIRKHSGISFRYEVAKGRGQFVCNDKLANTHGELASNMAEALSSNKWNGDRETWEEGVDEQSWQQLTSDRTSCKGRFCEFKDDCPYYKNSERVNEADVIVANHALVLSDLAMGGGIVLPSPSNSLYAIDEFHTFISSATNQLSKSVSLNSQVKIYSSVMKKWNGFESYLEAPQEQRCLRNAYNELNGLVARLKETIGLVAHYPDELLLDQGVVPDAIKSIAINNYRATKSALNAVEAFEEVHEDNLKSNSLVYGKIKQEVEQGLRMVLDGLKTDVMVWASYSRDDKSMPLARWFKKGENWTSFYVSPVSPAKALQSTLWSKASHVIGCSATLTIEGNFNQIIEESGIYAQTLKVPSPFYYREQCQLHIAEMMNEPSHAGFNGEVSQNITSLLSLNQSALVLFTSTNQMRAIRESLPDFLKDRVLLQGEMSKQEIIKTHKARVDRGEPSAIWGVDSFYEGVDLPKQYLELLVVVKLPFKVPNDPVTKTLCNHIQKQGRNAFVEVQVKQAITKFVQMCGRLIRTLEDSGNIFILDKRIITKRYGSQMLNSLPAGMVDNEIKTTNIEMFAEQIKQTAELS
ncbi:hypothetical protein A3715_37695 [Oleiphilus sp. HI0009]|nr:hypothetical protein A3715_37695 [Oleiphilus sp. HI0009]